MAATSDDSHADEPITGAQSTFRDSDRTSAPRTHGLLSGGCCTNADAPSNVAAPMSPRARRARAGAGLGFLVAAGAISSRQLPGQIALWPASLVPTWFGISHLVASVTGYQGCPELGAIPSIMLDRPVTTRCGFWRRIDSRIDPASRQKPSCHS